MRLIGIGGYKTSGKDSTFLAIKSAGETRGLNVERIGFADKLKIMAAMALGIEGQDEQLIASMDEAKAHWDFEISTRFNGEIKKFTGREYLQWFGANARKVFGLEFWVNQALPESKKVLEFWYPGVDILCVTDVRYSNEALRIHKLGGEIWRVERLGLESDGHSSEAPLPGALVDRLIFNYGTLDELQTHVANSL